MPSDKLQLTVDVAGRIARDRRACRIPCSGAISQALDKYPSIRLNSVQWQLGRYAAPKVPTAVGFHRAVVPVRHAAVGTDCATRRHQGSAGEHQHFVRELGKNEKVAEAKVTKMPLNLASTGSLSGSTASARQKQPQTSQFDVEVVLKPGV